MLKRLVWHRDSLKELKLFPPAVQRQVGYALHVAQTGGKHPDAKPLKTFAGVMEVASRWDGDTYRAVYYTKRADRLVVLHCFQKKSKHGIATPAHELDKIRQRLKELEEE